MKKFLLVSLLLSGMLQAASSSSCLESPRSLILGSVKLPDGTLSISTNNVAFSNLLIAPPQDRGFGLSAWLYERGGKKYQGAFALFAQTGLSRTIPMPFMHLLCQNFMGKCKEQLCVDTKEELESRINSIAKEINVDAAGAALSPALLMAGLLVQNGKAYHLRPKYSENEGVQGPFPEVRLTAAQVKEYTLSADAFEIAWSRT